MKTGSLFLSSVLLLCAACNADTGPPVVISDVRILAPLPGSTMAVAYMTITNNSGATVVIQGASSPQFERVEMHETTIEDGIARMRPLDHVAVEPGSTMSFHTGGKHLMLIGPQINAAPGNQVALEIRHDDGLLIVSATMQPRLPAQ